MAASFQKHFPLPLYHHLTQLELLGFSSSSPINSSVPSRTIIFMSGDGDTYDHYHLNGSLPDDIPENLKEFLHDDEGLSYDEIILQQVCVYQSYQEDGTSRVAGTDDDQSIDSSSSEDEGESSRDESVISQEAMDEAYARSLQEMGEGFDEFFISEFNSSPDSNQSEEINPDSMRYEELINLTEEVGVENVGLSAARISQLPISIYTSGMFSNNREETCVICQENLKFGKRMTALPCGHQYHRKCIIKWLKLKKNCPVCQKEVV